jgi:hypothetical protein
MKPSYEKRTLFFFAVDCNWLSVMAMVQWR